MRSNRFSMIVLASLTLALVMPCFVSAETAPSEMYTTEALSLQPLPPERPTHEWTPPTNVDRLIHCVSDCCGAWNICAMTAYDEALITGDWLAFYDALDSCDATFDSCWPDCFEQYPIEPGEQ